jgi:hypothetical protein
MTHVTIVNIKTNQPSVVSIETWEKIKSRPGLARAFTLKEVPVPPEILKLREAEEQAKNKQ